MRFLRTIWFIIVLVPCVCQGTNHLWSNRLPNHITARPNTLIASSASGAIKVYRGRSNYSSDVICTIRDGRVYNKNSVYSSDVLLTLRDGKIYRGNSVYTSDVLCTLRDGRVYKGTSTYTSDILFTLRDGRIYKGTSTYSSDILFHFETPPSIGELVAVILATGM